MDKWDELRQSIQELRDNNPDKPDVIEAMRFLLNLMDVITERRTMNDIDEMPSKCHACLYWELAEEPYSCDRREMLMYHMAEGKRDYCIQYEPTYNPDDGSL